MSTEVYIEDCYVAYMDILGFKNIILNKDKEYISGIFKEIDAKVIRTTINIYNGNAWVPLVPDGSIHRKIMSDSIVLFISKEYENSLPALLFTCMGFQSEMLALNEPILLRGGVSEGYMYMNGDTLFGKGLTNAYLLESKCARFPRIIIPKYIYDNYKYPQGINPYPYLIKNENDEYYSTDYMHQYLNPNPPKEFKPNKKLKDYIYICLNTYFDDSVRDKYLYLQNELLNQEKGE